MLKAITVYITILKSKELQKAKIRHRKLEVFYSKFNECSIVLSSWKSEHWNVLLYTLYEVQN